MEIIGKETQSRGERRLQTRLKKLGKIQISGRIVTSDKIWYGGLGGGRGTSLTSQIWAVTHLAHWLFKFVFLFFLFFYAY